MSRLRPALFAALVALALAAPAEADRDRALAAAQAGRTALAGQEWARAKELFQRALQEDDALADAKLGLAESIWGAGDQAQGLDAFRSLATELEEGAPLPKEDVLVYARVRQLLLQSGRDDAALDAILRKQADAYVAIANRFSARDAKAAELALTTALLLAPDHPKAGELLTTLKPSGTGKPIVLFTGKDLGGWQYMASYAWSLSEGAILGNVPDKPMLVATNESYSGDFDVVVEARMKEQFPKNGPPYFAIAAGWVDATHWVGLGLGQGDIWFTEDVGQKEPHHHVRKPWTSIPGVDPTAWTTLTLKFRGEYVTALLNGKTVARVKRVGESAPGRVCLKVQCSTVAFRRVELIPR